MKMFIKNSLLTRYIDINLLIFEIKKKIFNKFKEFIK